jgi:ribosomal protein S2
VIPGNDDAIRSCGLIVKAIADGIEAGKQKVSTREMAAKREPEPAAEQTAEAAPAVEEVAAAPEHEVVEPGEKTGEESA